MYFLNKQIRKGAKNGLRIYFMTHHGKLADILYTGERLKNRFKNMKHLCGIFSKGVE